MFGPRVGHRVGRACAHERLPGFVGRGLCRGLCGGLRRGGAATAEELAVEEQRKREIVALFAPIADGIESPWWSNTRQALESTFRRDYAPGEFSDDVFIKLKWSWIAVQARRLLDEKRWVGLQPVDRMVADDILTAEQARWVIAEVEAKRQELGTNFLKGLITPTEANRELARYLQNRVDTAKYAPPAPRPPDLPPVRPAFGRTSFAEQVARQSVVGRPSVVSRPSVGRQSMERTSVGPSSLESALQAKIRERQSQAILARRSSLVAERRSVAQPATTDKLLASRLASRRVAIDQDEDDDDNDDDTPPTPRRVPPPPPPRSTRTQEAIQARMTQQAQMAQARATQAPTRASIADMMSRVSPPPRAKPSDLAVSDWDESSSFGGAARTQPQPQPHRWPFRRTHPMAWCRHRTTARPQPNPATHWLSQW